MALQTGATGLSPSEAYSQIRSQAQGIKTAAQAALASFAANNVSTSYVFNVIDQLTGLINLLTTWSAVVGLNTYATAQGYTGTMTADITACNNAAQACVNWIITNFPKDSTAIYILDRTLNSDGTRTERTFSPAQTAGLQTLLTTFIATIG